MDICKVGDASPEQIWCAVGRALSYWESLNTIVATMYGVMFQPAFWPAIRAAGAISNRQSVRQFFIGAASVIFHTDPNLRDEIDAFLKILDRKGPKRDTIAHGVLYAEATYMGGSLSSIGPPPDNNIFTFGHTGERVDVPAQFFLVPPAFSSRHRQFSKDDFPQPTFKYNAARIDAIAASWQPLEKRATALLVRISQKVGK